MTERACAIELGWAWCNPCDKLFKVEFRTGVNTSCPTCGAWTSDCCDSEGRPVAVRSYEQDGTTASLEERP